MSAAYTEYALCKVLYLTNVTHVFQLYFLVLQGHVVHAIHKFGFDVPTSLKRWDGSQTKVDVVCTANADESGMPFLLCFTCAIHTRQ